MAVKTAPVSCENDIIYPVHPLDGTSIQHIIYAGFLKFNDILDASKIHDALVKLLQIGDWKKLGGRLRYSGKKLEIHVPEKYSSERPAFLYTTESFDCQISDHPSAGQFPQGVDGLCVKAAPSDLQDLAWGQGFPMAIGDMIDKDVPQLALKIITFTDATLIITRYPHISWDAFGYLALKKMLQLVLEGREDEVPPMLGANNDILSEMAKPYRGAQGGNELLERMKQNATQTAEATMPPAVEPRIVCIPGDIATRLMQRLQDSGDEDDDEHQALRSDELMTAWATQQVARAEPTPRSTAIMNLVNVRLIFPTVTKAKGIYTQNMILVASNTLEPEVGTGPVGPIAMSQRACISDLAAPDKAAQFLASIITAIEADFDTTAMSSGGDATPLLVNNLSNLTNGLDLDYSSALVSQGEDASTRTNPIGTVNFGYITDLTNPFPFPKLTILGKITGDTYWMFGELPTRAWGLIDEYLEDVSMS